GISLIWTVSFMPPLSTDTVHRQEEGAGIPLSRKRHRGMPAFLCRSGRSEEHTSELQSLTNLVCRLLLEKKKQTQELLVILTRYLISMLSVSLLSSFFFQYYAHHRVLLSFPTRRSSDLASA